MLVDPQTAALAALGIVLGGILKGATGAGAPVIGVPVLALAFDIPTAVVIFTIPNLLSNIWQSWAYRNHVLPASFTRPFAVAGFAGAGVGTIMLAELSPQVLTYTIATVVFCYVSFRLLRPEWRLGRTMATRMAASVGAASGVLQGAIGISAPISITFLNAMRLERPEFIATVSIFFLAMSLVQIPMMLLYGLMSGERALLGIGALVLIFAGMPIGSALGRRLPKKAFDWLLLSLLTVIAIQLLLST